MLVSNIHLKGKTKNDFWQVTPFCELARLFIMVILIFESAFAQMNEMGSKTMSEILHSIFSLSCFLIKYI